MLFITSFLEWKVFSRKSGRKRHRIVLEHRGRGARVRATYSRLAK